jgi:hypothetical protein
MRSKVSMILIGLQLHAKPNEVQYKDLALEDNPTEMKLLTVIPGK